MAKAFSLASWNVEHFTDNDPARVERVVGFVKEQNPDVFAIYEVKGRDVFAELVQRMPTHQFHITEGRQAQEILVGVRRTLTSFFTQRTEFRSGNPWLRPGALLTLHVGGAYYPILFLHTKSGGVPLGLGLRDDMFGHAFKLKRALDKAAKGTSNFIFVGDLNIMGMKYPLKRTIEASVELAVLKQRARRRGMKVLDKTHDLTWRTQRPWSYPPADLDHLVAARHVRFRTWAKKPVDVRGWTGFEDEGERDAWNRAYSDHAMLYAEVQKP